MIKFDWFVAISNANHLKILLPVSIQLVSE